MGTSSININGFKLTKTNPDLLTWYSGSKYVELYKKLSQLKIGDCYKIEGLEKDHILNGARTWCYKHVKGDYRIRTRIDSKSRVGYFYKTAK